MQDDTSGRTALRIGVIGAGWVGREHAASVAAIGGAEIVAVFDADPGSAVALADRYDATRAETLGNLLSRSVDAVVVATPSGVHRDAVIPALEAGIVVFVEKPLARRRKNA